MAVEYIGAVKIVSVSQSVSVPTDATIAVFCTGEYSAQSSHTLNGSSFTTAIMDGDASDMPQRITYLINPSTGSRTFSFNPPDSFAYGNWLIFLKGVDTANPVVSTASEEPATSPVSGLTAGAGDMMIGRLFGNYNSALSVAVSGQTQIDAEAERSAVAYKSAATDFQWTITGGSPIIGVAAVFRAATAAAGSLASKANPIIALLGR